jgi:hypothetical protein
MPRTFKKDWVMKLSRSQLRHLVEIYATEEKLKAQEVNNQKSKAQDNQYICWDCHVIFQTATEEGKRL